MALTIAFKNRTEQRHLFQGDIKMLETIKKHEMDNIDFIQADREELKLIREVFPHLTPVSKIGRWYGDLARTILWNARL